MPHFPNSHSEVVHRTGVALHPRAFIEEGESECRMQAHQRHTGHHTALWQALRQLPVGQAAERPSSRRTFTIAESTTTSPKGAASGSPIEAIPRAERGRTVSVAAARSPSGDLANFVEVTAKVRLLVLVGQLG